MSAWHWLRHCRSSAQTSGVGQSDRYAQVLSVRQTAPPGAVTQRWPPEQSRASRQVSWQRPKVQERGLLQSVLTAHIEPTGGFESPPQLPTKAKKARKASPDLIGV
jgi:hypothetical protein